MPSAPNLHPKGHLDRPPRRTGFSVDGVSRAPIRYDLAQPVEGLYVYLS